MIACACSNLIAGHLGRHRLLLSSAALASSPMRRTPPESRARADRFTAARDRSVEKKPKPQTTTSKAVAAKMTRDQVLQATGDHPPVPRRRLQELRLSRR